MTSLANSARLLAPAVGPRADAGFAGEADGEVRPFTRMHLGLLVAITVLGAALRFLMLGEWSIWVDEAHTWRDVTMPVEDFWARERAWYPTSFWLLRTLLEHGWLPQPTEGWLRLPFAFFGIVTVPLLAVVGHHVVGRRAALMGALFLAINPWHIHWSQNARGYVLVCMFAVLAVGTYWWSVRRGNRVLLLLAVLLALLTATCHPTGLALLPVFVAYPLLASSNLRGRRLWITGIAASIGLVLLPGVIELLPPFRNFSSAKPGSQPSLMHLAQTTAFYFRLPLLGAAVGGLIMLLRARLQGRVLFLACWALLPMLLLGLVGAFFVKVTARYGLCALPAVLLLAGAAVVRVGDLLARPAAGKPRRWAAFLLPAILCLDMGAYDYVYFAAQHGDRGRWREARDHVLRAAGGKPVFVCTTNDPSLVYYLRPNFHRGDQDVSRGPQVVALVPWRVFEHDASGDTYFHSVLGVARSEGRALFVVATLPELQEADPADRLRAVFASHFELLTVLPCWVGPKDESIWIWRARRP